MIKFSSKFLTVMLLLHTSAVFADVNFGSYLGQVIPLLPRGTSVQDIEPVLPGTPMSERIDGLVLKILATNSGRIFCGAVSDNPTTIRKAFFVNESSVAKALEVCSGQFKPRQIFLPWTKKYFITTTRQTDFPADGWTTPNNETFLFISKNEFNDDRLTRTLTHELAVSLDQKELFGYGGLIDVGQLGIVQNEMTCAIVPLVREGVVKQTLSALRAFDMEKKVADELRIPLPPRFADWSEKTCAQKIVFMSKHLERFTTSIAPETLVNRLMDEPSCSMASLKFSSVQIAADILERVRIKFENGTSESACDYFTDGVHFIPGISFRGGPGPRVGGGGW